MAMAMLCRTELWLTIRFAPVWEMTAGGANQSTFWRREARDVEENARALTCIDRGGDCASNRP